MVPKCPIFYVHIQEPCESVGLKHPKSGTFGNGSKHVKTIQNPEILYVASQKWSWNGLCWDVDQPIVFVLCGCDPFLVSNMSKPKRRKVAKCTARTVSIPRLRNRRCHSHRSCGQPQLCRGSGEPEAWWSDP